MLSFSSGAQCQAAARARLAGALVEEPLGAAHGHVQVAAQAAPLPRNIAHALRARHHLHRMRTFLRRRSACFAWHRLARALRARHHPRWTCTILRRKSA